MKLNLIVASGLCALTTGVHVLAGGPEINAVVQASGLEASVLATLGVVWHGVTVVLFVGAIVFALAARRRLEGAQGVLVSIFLGWAGLFLYYGVARLDSLWIMPQWIVFLVIAAVVAWGWKREAWA